jgi:hypothetical protein
MLFEHGGRAGDRQLRQFAVALIVVALTGVALRSLRHGALGWSMAAAASFAVAVGVVGAMAPRRIAWLFAAVTTVTYPIGLLVSEAMLVLLYFGIMTPMALLFRMARRDRLHRAIDPGAPTYWVAHRSPSTTSRYFRQS